MRVLFCHNFFNYRHGVLVVYNVCCLIIIIVQRRIFFEVLIYKDKICKENAYKI